MTNELFWNLYDSGEIETKIYTFETDKKSTEVAAFEFMGKYYLRICTKYGDYLLDRTAECGKVYRMGGYSSCVIKEFDTKNAANSYFKAVRKNMKS